MHYHGILLYGSNSEANLEKAYKIVYDFLKITEPNIAHITNNTYPDFLFVEKSADDNTISIEDIRNINDFVYLSPIISNKKALIINNIDYMSLNASNAFLKILEEPPQNVLLVLTTTKLFSVLPTIKSRCIKEKVRYSNDDISNYIQNKDNNFISESINYLNNDILFDEDFIKKYSKNVYDFILIAIYYLNKQLIANKDRYNTGVNILSNDKISETTQNINNNTNIGNSNIQNNTINRNIYSNRANKILLLQSLVNSSNNTYPNLENLMVAAMYIIKS